MKHQAVGTFLFSWLLVASAAIGSNMGKAEPVQWPAGVNVCQGVWSYKEYQSCEDLTHGPDLARPIIAEKDGAKCGYEKKQNSCWHGREHQPHDFIDTGNERLQRHSRNWTSQDLQAHCEKKARDIQLAPQQHLGTVTVLSSKIYGKICAEMEGRECMLWTFRADVQCRINFDHQIYGPSDECGSYIDDLTKPKTCVVGYHNINKRSSACNSLDHKTGRFMNASDLMKVEWRHGFSCSTSDDLPAESAEQVQKKYAFLVKKIQETQDTSHLDFDILTKTLSTLLAERSHHLDEAQISYATKVASKEIKVSKMSDGSVFDVSKDCAGNGSGHSRFCPSKRVVFDFGDISHLPRITSYTSMAHRLRYSFPCPVNTGQLSVRLIEGDNEFSLAPTADGSVQSTSIVYVQGQRPPQIEILADRNALFPDSCRLIIQASNLDLDPTLLLSSSNDLIDKIRMLSGFKVELDKASQLPERFKTVQALKDDLTNRIVEDIFKCQDLAMAVGRDPEPICPLNDDPTWACRNDSHPEEGELGVVINRIRENSCLYRDLQQGLPETVPCGTTGGSSGNQCLAGIQKIASIAEQEYQKSRSSAEELMKSLGKERTRIATKQPELERKIGIVVDSLSKGLAQTR
ncbi:hypothetical protein [Oligoflexus tunisiensis]|uniref:hypothetical protein n=1 Tax=Oligoflexus tunisiensis TaxID=708132 RepID=UPI00114CA3C5|nr:hypothetical protein [Oligoflexus tunisiensis]